MGSSVVPVLAIKILTEFENFVMKLPMENKILKVYYVYVIDMVVLVKVKEVQVGKIFKAFNSIIYGLL